MTDTRNDRFVRTTGRTSVVGGVLALAAMAMVFTLEASAGDEMMDRTGATVAGWTSFVAASLLVVGLLGLAVRYVGVLRVQGLAALVVLTFATAITVGATSTLALVVPDLLTRMPEIANDPPAVVPPTFILSGLVSGVAAIVLAVEMRRAGHRGLGTHLLLAGAVLTMVPLPSRFFMLAFAVGALLLWQDVDRDQRSPSLARVG